MLYTLAKANDPQDLVNLVNGLIQQGYEPHGSLCVLGQVGPLMEYCLYIQAMVKRFPNETSNEAENDELNEDQSSR